MPSLWNQEHTCTCIWWMDPSKLRFSITFLKALLIRNIIAHILVVLRNACTIISTYLLTLMSCEVFNHMLVILFKVRNVVGFSIEKS